jgi:hypothetical protein
VACRDAEDEHRGVLLVTRAAIRRQWRGLVLLTFLVALAGAVVLASVAGARRTASALDRFAEYSRVSDVEVDVDGETPSQIDALRRDPSVVGVAVLHQLILALPGSEGQGLPSAAAVDGSFGREVERPLVIRGRLARPTRAGELAIGERLASDLGVDVGDTITFGSFSTAQTEAAKGGAAIGAPEGPEVRFRVVGIVRLPLDLAVRGDFGGIVVPTPAFHEQYRDRIGGFFSSVLLVRAADGAAGVPDVIVAARRIFGDRLFQTLSVGSDTAGAADAIDALAVALWIFAGVATLAGATAVGIVTLRQAAADEREQQTLDALGLTAGQRALSIWTVLVPAAVVGGAVAVVAAALASPLFPIGLARKAEVDPGLRLDPLVLGVGFAAVVAFVLALAAFAAWRTAAAPARARGDDGTAPRAARPSTVARLAERAGAPPAMTVGARMALEPGRGHASVPVRSAFFGMALGAVGIVAVLVFGASTRHLVETPRLWGWSWDTAVSGPPPASDPQRLCGDVDSVAATRDSRFAAVAGVCLMSVEVDRRPVTAWGFTPIRGTVAPELVAGREPTGPDEVALGGSTLDALGKDVGDTVRVRSFEETRRYRVVGQVVLPNLGADQSDAIADGAAFTADGLLRVNGPESVPDLYIVGRFRDDFDPAELPTTESGLWRFPSGLGLRPLVPPEVDRVRQVDDLPTILAGLLALLATVAVGHTLLLSVRRRRHDLAVLRTIGFERRDVRATIAYESTIFAVVGVVVGVPLGFAAGRLLWEAVADSLGVASRVRVPAVGLLVVALGALVVVNVVGAIAAIAAIRDRPAAALAVE